MTSLRLLVALLLLQITATAGFARQTDTHSTDAPIANVTIYRGYGAIVTRRGTARIDAGASSIRVMGITSDLDEDYGVRVVLVGGGARLAQVNVLEQHASDVVTDAQKAIQMRIDTLEAEQRQASAALEAARVQLRFIESLGRSATRDATSSDSADAKVRAMEASLAFVRDSSEPLLQTQAQLEHEIAKRKQRISALKRELAQTGGQRESLNDVELKFHADAPTTVEFELSYLIEDATWDIAAEARLNSEGNQLALELYGVAKQQSGEDWLNVPLALSTTEPSETIGAAMPSPTYVNIIDAELEPKMVGARAPVRRELAAMDVEEVIVTGSRNIGQRVADYSAAHFDASFVVNVPVTIPADGSEQRFLLSEATTDSAIVTRAAPQLAQHAYVYADATFADIPHLQEPIVALTRDNAYVGTGGWPELLADQPLKLPFGSDEKIDIELVRIPSEDGETGIFNRRQVEQEKKQFRITNNHSRSVIVEIFDSRPNSMNEDLEIEILRGNTPPTETNVDGKPGVLMWRKELAAGETWEINHWYRLSYPLDQRLVPDWP